MPDTSDDKNADNNAPAERKGPDPLLGDSMFERDGEYLDPADYPADEKIASPAEQAGGRRPAVIGTPDGADDPQVDLQGTEDNKPKAPSGEPQQKSTPVVKPGK